MPKYVLVYTLKGQQKKYDCIMKVLQKIAPSNLAKIEDSVWTFEIKRKTDTYTLKNIYNLFSVCLDPDDKLLIAGLDGRGEWQGHALDHLLKRPD